MIHSNCFIDKIKNFASYYIRIKIYNKSCAAKGLNYRIVKKFYYIVYFFPYILLYPLRGVLILLLKKIKL